MATVVSFWTVGPLYGMNICVFILCAHVLYMKGLKAWNLMMLFVASLQFAISTGHVITIVVQLVRGFGGTSTNTSYVINPATPEHLAQEFLYITNCLIGDAILIWRLWIIWDRNFWLAGPFVVLCIATAATGYTGLINLAQLSPNETVYLPRVHNWLIATWCLSIATQLGATLMIGYRFWKSIRWNSTRNGICKSRLDILWILVESGALYSVTMIFMLGFSTTNIGGIFVVCLGQISALAPTLIIVRAGLRGSPPSSIPIPVKGSIIDSDSLPTSGRYSNREMESYRTRLGGRDVATGTTMIVHVKKATEIHLDDLVQHDGDMSSSDGRSRSSKLPEYASEYSDV